MTNNLQALYDILGEAYKAGHDDHEEGPTAGSILVPLAARMEKLVGWQPIETAPKDGTVIFGARVEAYPDDTAYPEGATMMWEGGEGRVLKGCWAYTGLRVRVVKDEYQPTHWLPLPSFPEREP